MHSLALSHKKILVFLGIVILLIALPVVLFLQSQEQDIRQEAAGSCVTTPGVADIMFVVDFSGSTSGYRSQQKVSMKNFVDQVAVNNTAYATNPDPNKRMYHIGIVSYAAGVNLNYSLQNGSDYAAVKNAIDTMPAIDNASTGVDTALNMANAQFGSFGRNGVRKVIIFLTDKSDDAAYDGFNTYGTSYNVLAYGLSNTTIRNRLMKLASDTGGIYREVEREGPTQEQLVGEIAADVICPTVTPAITQVPTNTPPTPTIQTAFTVTGIFFEDRNANGTIDSGEINDRPLRPRITLTDSQGNTDSISNESRTGAYSFSGLAPGTYTLNLSGNYGTEGYYITTPLPFPYTLTVGPNRTINIGIVSGSPPTPTSPTRTPTPTTIVTAAPTLLQTHFGLQVLFHGIGKSGDSANENSFTLSNQNPLTATRPVTVEVFESQPGGQTTLVTTKNGIVTFQPTTGSFTGTIDMGTILQNKTYLVKLKSDKYLRRIVGIPTVTAGTTVQIPVVSLIAGDTNNDNTLDILDYNTLHGCYSVDAPPRSCTSPQKFQTDTNDDGKINQFDYNLFLRELGNRSGE